MARPELRQAQVEAFLSRHHGTVVEDLNPLSGGFWSSAFSYRVKDTELVARFGADRGWFEADRAAMTFGSADLPVPAVIEIGEAFDGYYALSIRHHGSYLEDIRPDQVDTGGPMLARLLEALFRVPGRRDEPVDWYAAKPTEGLTWRSWLSDGLVDDAARPVHGWRASLADDPALNRLYNACEERIRSLAEACPERRDVVHGDLLHGNVLVTENAGHVTAVFSWKCSVRGDFLYDTAWCSFWGASHPGVAAADPWGRIRTSASVLAEPEALRDAALRHHCYELHIGAVHLAWNVWVDDREWLQWTARHTDMVLERGPLSD